MYKFLIELVKKRDINIVFLGFVFVEDQSIEGYILFIENFLVFVFFYYLFVEWDNIWLWDLRNEDFVLFLKGFILYKMVFDVCK